VKAIVFLPQGNNSVKGPSTQRDPSVAISLADLDDAYSEAQIRGVSSNTAANCSREVGFFTPT
jgi:hypothetical protein